MSARVINGIPLQVAKRIYDRHCKPKPKVKMVGIAVVWGIPPEIKPVAGIKAGIVRYKFRNGQLGKVYVRNGNETREYYIEIRDGQWIGRPMGINKKGEK